MRRMMAGVVAVLIGVCVSTSMGAELDLGMRGGYQKVADMDAGGFVVGGFLRTDWRGVIFFEGSVMYNSEESSEGGVTVDVEFIPIQLSAEIFFLRRDEMWCPYILAGGGAYIVRTVNNAASDSETDFDFGWHLGLGVDVALSEKFFVEADLRYIWLDVDTEGRTFADTLSDFNTWQASLGFGFRI